MENSVDDLKLKPEISSYSSFYKTQLSLHRDKSKLSDSNERNLIHDTTNRGTEAENSKTDEARGQSPVNTNNITSNDLKNNSSDNKEGLHEQSDSQQNMKFEDDLNETKQIHHNDLCEPENAISVSGSSKEQTVRENERETALSRLSQKESSHTGDMSRLQHSKKEVTSYSTEQQDQTVTLAKSPGNPDVSIEGNAVKDRLVDSVEPQSKANGDQSDSNKNMVTKESSEVIPSFSNDIRKDEDEIKLTSEHINNNESPLLHAERSEKENIQIERHDHNIETETSHIKDQTDKVDDGKSINPLQGVSFRDQSKIDDKHNTDLDQMPDIEAKSESKIALKENEILQDQKRDAETVLSLKESSGQEISNDTIIQNNNRNNTATDNRPDSTEKHTPILELTNSTDTSDKRSDPENKEMRAGVDAKGKNMDGNVDNTVHIDNEVTVHIDNEVTNVTKYASKNMSSEKIDISKKNTSTYDNLYFTGRLPSLLSRNESQASFPIKKVNDNEAIAENPEHLLKSETFRISRENEEHDRGRMENINHSFHDEKSENDVSKRKLDERKTPTPSRKIREMIAEMRDPSNNVFSMSMETRINPANSSKQNEASSSLQERNKNDIFTDAISEVQGANEPEKERKDNVKSESANMTVDDITVVTTKVLGTTRAEDRQSKFDNLPQMKNIKEYLLENVKREHSPSKLESEDVSALNRSQDIADKKSPNEIEGTRTSNDDVTNRSDSLPRRNTQSSDHIPQTESVVKFFQSESQSDIEQKRKPGQAKSPSMQETGDNTNDTQIQRSSSENDLRAIIASAKVAISNGTETTDSNFGFETSDTSGLTLTGDTMSLARKRTNTRSSRKGVWTSSSYSDNKESLSSLICSSCLRVDSNIYSAGYCTNCQQYLCSTCISVHTIDKDTRFHEIVPSYCKNELAINKYVPATGYCVDCSMFLCRKCVVQHTGFRANRHHKIIQSSFISRQSERQKEVDVFLDEIQEKIDPKDSKAAFDDINERKRKRKLLSDLDGSNPYGVPFSKVPESLYPGPNKKLSSSYAKNPKWVHSSIPNLPYLVPPKPIPDRVFNAAGHRRPQMIYTKPKTGIDAMASKLKFLKSRYKIKDGAKTSRRRDQALYTARPVKNRENLSLPDVSSVKSIVSGRRSVKQSVGQSTTVGRKEVEFINEYCLSIPFPRGEKRTDILAMTVLMTGKLAVLDKNNNNIKLYDKSFHCMAALQFQNRLIDICASNLCPTDFYAATSKHIYEISAQKGMDISRKMKVEIKRIEGIDCWKYGLAIVSKKTNITWEIRLLDYRGNLKSKLEVFNPFTLDIASSTLHHMTSSRGGKYISLSDTKNSCIITVDVTTRVVMHETMLEEGKHPTYITSDGEGNHNLYVTSDNKVFQISRKGKVLGVLIDKAKENGDIGCITYNKQTDRMYVKTGKDMISVYQIYF